MTLQPTDKLDIKDGVEQFPVAYSGARERWRSVCCSIIARIWSPSEPHREPAAVASARVVPRARAVAEARGVEPGARAGPGRPTATEAAGRRAGQGRARAGVPAAKPGPPDEAAPVGAARARQGARPQLLAELGCGALTAAILIGHTAGFKQFRKPSSFGLQTGTAPIPCSSGKRTKHRLNRGGDRQLNHALHIIAITRAQHDPATKEYLARKEAEGKTTKGALRSLKRHLARRFYRLLADTPADQEQAPNGEPSIEPEPTIAVEPTEIPPPPAPRRAIDPTIPAQAPFPMVCIS